MPLIRNCSLLLLVMLSGACARHRTELGALPGDTVQLADTDRVLVLAPHPDDEVLGAGGLMQRAAAMGLPVRVAFLTNGDFNEWAFIAYRVVPPVLPSEVRRMGALRMEEARRADALLGVPQDDLTFLGYPDAGTFSMWTSHWNSEPPARGRLTGARAVPYSSALRPGAPYLANDVVEDLKSIISDFKPTIIAVSHPADAHPDHRALYLFTIATLWEMADSTTLVLPYLVHYAHWPRRAKRGQTMQQRPPADVAQTHWVQFPLTDDQMRLERIALREHRTQMRVGSRFLTRFARSPELFGEVLETRLVRGGPPQVLVPKAETRAHPPETFESDEGRQPVNLGEVSVALRGDTLALRMQVSGVVEKDLGFSMFLFGWRHDRSFAQMPKLELRVTARGWSLRDQGRLVQATRAVVRRRNDAWSMAVPLRLAGEPERLLIGGRSVTAGKRLSALPWRAVDLRNAVPR